MIPPRTRPDTGGCDCDRWGLLCFVLCGGDASAGAYLIAHDLIDDCGR
jgi:hypothetical protein